MQPISGSLDKLQKGKSTIGDATHIWKELFMNTPDEYNNSTIYRYHQAITNYHLLAYLINPKYIKD